MSLRRSLGIAAVALAALSLFYVVAWFHIADRLEQGIDHWAAERRTEGWIVAYGEVEISGFPLAWRARLPTPRLQRTAGEPAFLWSGLRLDLSWQPWVPRRVDFRSGGQHRLGLGEAGVGAPVLVEMGAAEGRLHLGETGRLQKLALRVDNATIAPPDGDRLRLGQLVATVDIDLAAGSAPGSADHRKPSLRLDATLSGLTLPATPRPALGRNIGLIALRGAILGRLPAAKPREALESWRADGGTVEVEHFELGWSALGVRAEGTVALDAGLQPVGAMTAWIAGYNETADALMAAGLIKPGEALVAKLALGALARKPANGGTPQIRVPLAVQDGWLFVGPIRLLPVPPLRWE